MALGTALTVASLAATAASTGMSIAQASKARRDRDEADREAQRLLEEAESQMEINPFDAIAIQKEPYEMAFDAAVEAAATESQALAEADPRLAAGLAGKRRMAQEESLQGVRASMGQQMLGLEQASAAEDAKLRDQRTNLLTNQAIGQMNEADFQETARQTGISNAIQSGASLLGQAAQAAPLFTQSAKDQLNTLSSIPKLNAEQAGLAVLGAVAPAAGAASSMVSMANMSQNQKAALENIQNLGLTNQLPRVGEIVSSGDLGELRRFRRELGDEGYNALLQYAQLFGQ